MNCDSVCNLLAVGVSGITVNCTQTNRLYVARSLHITAANSGPPDHHIPTSYGQEQAIAISKYASRLYTVLPGQFFESEH